jgi:hypothetical protein
MRISAVQTLNEPIFLDQCLTFFLELDLKTSMKLEDLKVKWVGFATFIPL